MKRLVGYICCSILMSVIAAGKSSAAENKVMLVKDGKANATIVIAADPSPAADLASIEVQYFVEQMTGAKLPIADDGKGTNGNKILIGESRHTKKLGLDVSKYHQMESLIRFYPEAIVLLGRDDLKKDCRLFKKTAINTASTIDYAKANGIKGKTQKVFIPGMFDYQGSLRATYRFLEDWCDVRFFGANPMNVHVPKAKTLIVSGNDHHHRTAIDTKSGAMGMYGRRSGNSEYGPRPDSQQVTLYQRRLRWGGVAWYVNHTFQHFNYRNRFMNPVEPTDKIAQGLQAEAREIRESQKRFRKDCAGSESDRKITSVLLYHQSSDRSDRNRCQRLL